jgi:hypothetical protein
MTTKLHKKPMEGDMQNLSQFLQKMVYSEGSEAELL